jgi:ribonuclease HI
VWKVQLTTDGSCIGNPGPGGWACVLRAEGFERELIGRDPRTTNNRMELMAAIRGLAALEAQCEVEVITDSEYLLRGVTERLARWKSNGWKTATGKVVLNQDLWKQLDVQVKRHKITWTWVRGHGNNPDQNRCDGLAWSAAREQQAMLAQGLMSV